MPQFTFYPLGNGDTCLVDLVGGEKILIDFADRRVANDPDDRRIDLTTELKSNLAATKRDDFDVVLFTHLDLDHVQGADAFFHWDHDTSKQGDGRIKVNELWVPAAIVLDDQAAAGSDAATVRAEARHRLKVGVGIRVFACPQALVDWLKDEGIDIEDRRELICYAGDEIPTFTTDDHGVTFFLHSPFAAHHDGAEVDRNLCSVVLQATFTVDGTDTRVLFAADVASDLLDDVVTVSRDKGNADRLAWDVLKIPHHCSYKALNKEDKGKDMTEPTESVGWLLDQGTHGAHAGDGAILVSTSDSIPTTDTDDDQPPHRQAAARYRAAKNQLNGYFFVTMEHPRRDAPEPLIITIGDRGPIVEMRNRSAIATVIQRPARAG